MKGHRGSNRIGPNRIVSNMTMIIALFSLILISYLLYISTQKREGLELKTTAAPMVVPLTKSCSISPVKNDEYGKCRDAGGTWK